MGKPKHNLKNKIICVKETSIGIVVKNLEVKDIRIKEDGIWYGDGINSDEKHMFNEEFCFKTREEAQAKIDLIISKKVDKYKKKLIGSISRGE